MTDLTYQAANGTGVGNITLLLDPNLCTLETCSLSLSSFNYIPSLGGNAVFAAIFGVCILGQLFLGIKYRIWGYMGAMILGLVLEVIGYAARVMLSNSPFNNSDFIMYLTCLAIAPALLSASIYLCLARIITVYGEPLSRFKPRTYTIVFCTCDFICLVLQGAGGGIASTGHTRSQVDDGKNIMLVGLIIQVISLSLFAVACTDFAWRVSKNQGQWNQKHFNVATSKLFKAFLVGLFTAALTIFVRSVYRCAELAGGFNGTLFRDDEALFMVLEGAMISIACLCLTILHPGICFQGAWHDANFSLRSRKEKYSETMNSVDSESAMESGVDLSNFKVARNQYARN